MRRKLSAAHTSLVSQRTFSMPLKLNCLNPSTCLIQALGGSTMTLRLRYLSRPSSVCSLIHDRQQPGMEGAQGVLLRRLSRLFAGGSQCTGVQPHPGGDRGLRPHRLQPRLKSRARLRTLGSLDRQSSLPRLGRGPGSRSTGRPLGVHPPAFWTDTGHARRCLGQDRIAKRAGSAAANRSDGGNPKPLRREVQRGGGCRLGNLHCGCQSFGRKGAAFSWWPYYRADTNRSTHRPFNRYGAKTLTFRHPLLPYYGQKVRRF